MSHTRPAPAPHQAWRDRLLGKLDGKDPTGEAYRTLCAAGCDVDQLTRQLLRAEFQPWQQTTLLFTESDRRKLRRIASKLEDASSKLASLTASQLSFLDPLIEGDDRLRGFELPEHLRSIANSLLTLERNKKIKRLRSYTVFDFVPHLIAWVKQQTGKPHYREVTRLLQAAYQDSSISEDSLKMMVKRYRSRHLRKK